LNSSMVNKIAKAKQYAERPDRVSFTNFEVDFDGDNDVHRVTFADNTWRCNCDFFGTWKICSHTMAIERILGPMLKVQQSIPELATTA
jgi:hypothetical protein